MFKLVLKKRIQVQFLLLIFLMGFGQLAVAKKTPEISLEEASKQILASSNGKILSAKTTTYNGRKTHRIQVLTSTGRVKIFQIPASKSRFKSDHYSNDRVNRNRTNRYSNPHNNQYQNNHSSHNLYTRPKHQTSTSKDSKHK